MNRIGYLVSTAPVPDAVSIEVKLPAAAPGQAAAGPNPFATQNRLPGLGRIVAVASGKGGVGKSTCSVNLACALQQLGLRVGLLDCDIYGPSIPLMMGIKQRPTINPQEKMVPPANHGVKLMSMGFLLDGDQPVIWRGPMINKTIQQFFQAVEWGELDYLLVDLPPGTGDAQTDGGRPVILILSRGTVMTRSGVDALKEQLWAEAMRRGLGRANEVLIVADGAVWIWNLAGDRFAGALPARGFLSCEPAPLGRGAHVASRRRSGGPRCGSSHSWPGSRPMSAAAVITELEQLQRRLEGAAQERVQKEVNYLQSHRQREDEQASDACGSVTASE